MYEAFLKFLFLLSFFKIKYVQCVSSGTAAIKVGLKALGVKYGDEVITQPLTFIATCNAINYCGAHPIFIDVDKETMGLSPDSLNSLASSFKSLNSSLDIIIIIAPKVSVSIP